MTLAGVNGQASETTARAPRPRRRTRARGATTAGMRGLQLALAVIVLVRIESTRAALLGVAVLAVLVSVAAGPVIVMGLGAIVTPLLIVGFFVGFDLSICTTTPSLPCSTT